MTPLIALDELAQAESLLVFSKACKHEASGAMSLQMAEELAVMHPPDAVIEGVNLPDGAGPSFLGWLRGAPD
ncbi:MAG: hypothetical protein ACRESF_08160 [Pseudomonas sp.]